MSQFYVFPPGFGSDAPAGSATAANQVLEIAQLTAINGKLGTLGQKTMAGSAPVVIASDQSPITVTGSITATNPSVGTTGAAVPASATFVGFSDSSGNLASVALTAAGALPIAAASLPLPSGASTSALQTQISGQLPATLGAHVTAASLAVNIASDQTVPVSAAALPLPSGAATAALQSALNAQIPATLGAHVIAASLAVNIASDQVVPVSISSSPLPSGAATSANQVTEIASLSSIDSKTPALGQAAMAASSPVVIASDQSAVPISAASLPLPAGAATSAKQPALGTAGTASADVITVQGIASMTALKVDGSGVTQPISAVSLPLPSGAATSALQTTISGQLPATLGQKAMAASLAVTIASDQSSVPSKLAGKAAIGKARNDYTSVNVTTGAYVQLIASTAAAVSEVFIFDSSGQTLVLATGGAGVEVDQFYIVPGGNGTVPISIAASTRISIKAVSATANAGEIDLNLFG